jgi:hypothetical protein
MATNRPQLTKRHVDLPGVAHAGVLDVQARQVAQLDHLLGHAEGAGDQRLRRNHGGQGGQQHQRHQRPVGRHQVERVLDRLGVLQQQRALAKVVQRERRHHDGEPGQADRLLAEMAQVGVQRLGAGDAQHHGTQDDEGGARVGEHEAQRVVRADGARISGMAHDVRHAQHRDQRTTPA